MILAAPKGALKVLATASLSQAAAKAACQVAEKVEVQEAVPSAGVLGAESLSLMPKHFSREPTKRRFRTMTANQGFFDSLSGRR